MNIEIKNSVERICNDIDLHNKKLDESNTKDVISDIDRANKEFIKEKFYGQKIFGINGFKKEKFSWYKFIVNLARENKIVGFLYDLYFKLKRFLK